MANRSGIFGYGGGGVGGGELTNNNFIEGCGGANGCVFAVLIKSVPCVVTDRFKIHAEDNDFPIINMNIPSTVDDWTIPICGEDIALDHAAWKMDDKKIRFSTIQGSNKLKSYDILSLPGNLYTVQSNEGLKQNSSFGYAQSKMMSKSDSEYYKFYYKKGSDNGSVLYAKLFRVTSPTSNENYIVTVDSGEKLYVFVTAQGAGGGGGGADNTYGLFNYAGGGGGGGSGAAYACRVVIDQPGRYQLNLSCGDGGAAGVNRNYGTNGEAGTLSGFSIQNPDDYSTIYILAAAGGGYGGNGGGSDPGGGGAGGDFLFDGLWVNDSSKFMKDYLVKGCAGARGSGGGVSTPEITNNATSGTIESSFLDVTWSLDTTLGSQLPQGSGGDQGGRGGISWFGDGGGIIDDSDVPVVGM